MTAGRNRIVIDLNRPPQGAGAARYRGSRSGGAGRVLAIIGIILVVVIIGIAAGLYFWWQHLKTQPSYTLAVLVDASQRNDTAEIDRILDMDQITQNFISDVRSHLTGTSLIDSLVPGKADQIVATITPQLKETLHDALPAEIQRVSGPAKGKPFILVALSVPYFADIKVDGASATADIKSSKEQIQLVMKQENANSWRIVTIKDDRLAGIIADAAKKGWSQRDGQLQDDVLRQLKDLKLPGSTP